MNHDYQKVVETMQEMGVDESYIEKALKDYGYNEFPKSGLDDIGLSKLLHKAIDIAYDEARLVQRKPKKDYLSVPKVKKEKAVSLEEKVGKTSSPLDNSLKIFTYPTLGITFALPTMWRKWGKILESELGRSLWNTFPLIGGFAISLVAYEEMPQKLILPIALTQIATNLASLGYEYVRHVKGKSRKNRNNLTGEEIEKITIREDCYRV